MPLIKDFFLGIQAIEKRTSPDVFLPAAYIYTEQLAFFRGARVAVSCFLPTASAQPPAAHPGSTRQPASHSCEWCLATNIAAAALSEEWKEGLWA